MSIAHASRFQLIGILDKILYSNKPLFALKCETHQDAVRLRLRLNKIRQVDRAEKIRAQKVRKTPEYKIDAYSPYDRLVFQILPNADEVLIHKQEETGQLAEDFLFIVEPDGARTKAEHETGYLPEEVEYKQGEEKLGDEDVEL